MHCLFKPISIKIIKYITNNEFIAKYEKIKKKILERVHII